MKKKVRLALAFDSICIIYCCLSDIEVEPMTAIVLAVVWLALIIYALS